MDSKEIISIDSKEIISKDSKVCVRERRLPSLKNEARHTPHTHTRGGRRPTPRCIVLWEVVTGR